MSTENRSSNTEMVCVPREHDLKFRRAPLNDLLSGAKTSEIRDCSDREFAAGDTILLREIDDTRPYTGRTMLRTITHVQKHYGLPDHLCVLSYGEPAPQPHPEPIAWIVGTAIWWTKEEAERDAADTGLPIVGLGPMTGIAPVKQHKGTLVGEVVAFGKGLHEIAWAAGRMPKLGVKLFTHAVPGEVERLREGIAKRWKVVCDQRAEIESLRDQVAKVVRSGALTAPEHEVLEAECCALSASAGPSSPTWSCQACQVEQPTDRACDACGGQTSLIAAKS